MIKLRIGKNYLIVNPDRPGCAEDIIYMMGCFNKEGQTAISSIDIHPEGLKAIKEEKGKDIYVLLSSYHDWKKDRLELFDYLKNECPDKNFIYIKTAKDIHTNKYEAAKSLYSVLCQDPNSILYHLDKLDIVKKCKKRAAQIDEEIKLVKSNIKKLKNQEEVIGQTATLKELEYLDLIEKVEEDPSGGIVLTIKPLNINPSEPLGEAIAMRSIENKPWLREVCKYIYKGCHFRMPATKILIDNEFRPKFIDTLDHTWDAMFSRNNWSTIGYPHFGKGHLCGGEFNEVMTHAKEYGLEYYFISLKQYLTTANMRDLAGKRVLWFPIYDDNNNLVYSAPLEFLRQKLLSRGYPVRDLSCADLLEYCKEKDLLRNIIDINYSENCYDSTCGNKEDNYLQYLQEHDYELYEEIKKGAK